MRCKKCGNTFGQRGSASTWELRARELDRASDPHGESFREIVRDAGVYCSPRCLVAYLAEHYGPKGDFYRDANLEAMARSAIRLKDDGSPDDSDEHLWTS